MADAIPKSNFSKGLLWGIGSGCVIGAIGLIIIGSNRWLNLEIRHWSEFEAALNWLGNNMGSALIPFSMIIIFHCAGQLKLGRMLSQKSVSIEKISQTEHWLEILESLAFGVGVLWTAIGMRAALLAALGNPSEIGGAESASLILEKLVNGGILIALSTTIAGGIIGYLLRLLKVYTLGLKIRYYYEKIEKGETKKLLFALARIENAVSKNTKILADQVNKSS